MKLRHVIEYFNKPATVDLMVGFIFGLFAALIAIVIRGVFT